MIQRITVSPQHSFPPSGGTSHNEELTAKNVQRGLAAKIQELSAAFRKKQRVYMESEYRLLPFRSVTQLPLSWITSEIYDYILSSSISIPGPDATTRCTLLLYPELTMWLLGRISHLRPVRLLRNEYYCNVPDNPSRRWLDVLVWKSHRFSVRTVTR